VVNENVDVFRAVLHAKPLLRIQKRRLCLGDVSDQASGRLVFVGFVYIANQRESAFHASGCIHFFVAMMIMMMIYLHYIHAISAQNRFFWYIIILIIIKIIIGAVESILGTGRVYITTATC